MPISEPRLLMIGKAAQAGWSFAKIMLHFNCSDKTIRKARVAVGLPAFKGVGILPDNVKYAIDRDLTTTNLPLEHIARKHGVSARCVTLRRDKLNGIDRNIQLDAKRRGERI